MSDYNKLKRSEKRTIDTALDMETGYVLDFSNRTIEEYFEDEFSIEFYDDRYGLNGNSKANRVRTILASLSGAHASHILRNLWDYRSTLPIFDDSRDQKAEEQLTQNFFRVVAKLDGDGSSVDLQAFAAFDSSNTLSELLSSIERDIRADKPQAAIDRLHLFCVKMFRHLLAKRSVGWTKNEALHALCGKYKKALEVEGSHSEMALLFIRYSIAVFDKFNDLRNDRSLAHDNELLSLNEAKFIFDAVGAVLRFIKTVDPHFRSYSID